MENNIDILERLNQSALKLLAAPTLEKLCKIIVEEARKLVQAEHGSLFLQEKNKLERVYTTSLLLKRSKIKKRGYLEKAFRAKKVTLLGSSKTQRSIPEYKAIGIKSVVLLPLSYKSLEIGMLVIHSLNESHFTSKQLHILKLYASMACLAIIKSRLHDETKKALELRDRFISLASHELRTPLTSINGYIQLLYTKLANKNTLESRWMEELYNESIRLTNLVKELLDINRIKQGEFAFSLCEVDMREVVEKVIKQYRSYNPDREIIFEDNMYDNRYRIIGDFDKLREMVSALLSNAVKFSTPQTKIVISLTPSAKKIHMQLRDYGQGIPKQDIGNIFQGFYKTNYNEEKQGLGVGLLLAQHVVNFHKGKLSITSKQKSGTTVDVELPRMRVA